MGSQWADMARDMIHGLPVFRQSFTKCNAALKNTNFSIRQLILEGSPECYTDPQNAFVGICAVQVGGTVSHTRKILHPPFYDYFSSIKHKKMKETQCSKHVDLQGCVSSTTYTPSQWGNYHHSMFHNPTAAVNLFHVGKQYLTFCKAEAAVTHNLIGRKIISNVKHSDARNSLPI